MFSVVAVLAGLCVWIMAFKLCFGNKDGFLRCINSFMKTKSLNSWNKDEDVDSAIKAALKLFLWLSLGVALWYLAIFLTNP